MFDGFAVKRITTKDTDIHLRLGGSGPPLLLLHGYPQTHTMWHKIAPALAEHFTVVTPDLRGYGDSAKPASDAAHVNYSKRTMANDQVAVMRALGFARFAVCGHDRGGRVAYRMALDHDCVTQLAVLDIVPTLEQFERMGKEGSLGSFHWYFLAQPAPFPETLIGAQPDYFLHRMLQNWRGTEAPFTTEAMAEYERCFRNPETIRATCEDYRAGASIDCELDAQDRQRGHRIACPMLALWGDRGRAHKRRDVLEIWRAWATAVSGRGLDCGHFLPEEAPEETLQALRTFFKG
jgi:haloacetate dehalogenase